MYNVVDAGWDQTKGGSELYAPNSTKCGPSGPDPPLFFFEILCGLDQVHWATWLSRLCGQPRSLDRAGRGHDYRAVVLRRNELRD